MSADAMPWPQSARCARAGRGLLLAALGLLLGACGDTGSGQSGSAFVFLSVDGFSTTAGGTASGQVLSVLSAKTTSTLVCVTLRNTLKNPTVTVPTALDDVVVQSYTVRIILGAGGPDPRTVTHGTAVTVPAGTTTEDSPGVSGNTRTFGIIVVPAQLKVETPLSTTPGPRSGTAEIIFRGRDGRGQEVEARGAIAVLFVSTGGTDSACSGTAPTTPTTPTTPTNGTNGGTTPAP